MQIKYDNITSNNELEKFIPFNIVLLAQELPLRGYQDNLHHDVIKKFV